jgi:hypothetical protein
MDKLTYITHAQRHPRKKPIGFVVKVGGVTYYGPVSAALARHYINIHGLGNATLKGVYGKV